MQVFKTAITKTLEKDTRLSFQDTANMQIIQKKITILAFTSYGECTKKFSLKCLIWSSIILISKASTYFS
jgi:hypothetical protein